MLKRNRRSDRRAVIAAYEAMLGRVPESEEVIESYRGIGIDETLRTIARSSEFEARRHGSPFFYYNSAFDAREVITRHARHDLSVATGVPDELPRREDRSEVRAPGTPRACRRGRRHADSSQLARRHGGVGCRASSSRPSSRDVHDRRARLRLGLLDEQHRRRGETCGTRRPIDWSRGRRGAHLLRPRDVRDQRLHARADLPSPRHRSRNLGDRPVPAPARVGGGMGPRAGTRHRRGTLAGSRVRTLHRASNDPASRRHRQITRDSIFCMSTFRAAKRISSRPVAPYSTNAWPTS